MKYELYFDGGCRQNPSKIAAWGYLIYERDERGSKKLVTQNWDLCEGEDIKSSNVGEYQALIEGLKWLLDNGKQHENIVIFGDSKLVISQMFRGWSIKKGYYVDLAREALYLIYKFPNAKGRLIPRHKNTRADELVNLAYQDL